MLVCLYTVYTSSTDPECPDESLSGVCRGLVSHLVVPPNRLFLQFNVFYCARVWEAERRKERGAEREREEKRATETERGRERGGEGERERETHTHRETERERERERESSLAWVQTPA